MALSIFASESGYGGWKMDFEPAQNLYIYIYK
jgi:hypothetical protein